MRKQAERYHALAEEVAQTKGMLPPKRENSKERSA
jgi:hypothetical protein